MCPTAFIGWRRFEPTAIIGCVQLLSARRAANSGHGEKHCCEGSKDITQVRLERGSAACRANGGGAHEKLRFIDDIIDYHRPMAFVSENVKNRWSSRKSSALQIKGLVGAP